MAKTRRTPVYVVSCNQKGLHACLERMGEMWADYRQLGGMPNAYEGYVLDLVVMFGRKSALSRAFGVRGIFDTLQGRYPC